MPRPAPAKISTSPSTTLNLRRQFKAPPNRVFRAFTDVAMLRQWWGPRGFTTPEAELDARPGGKYRLHMRSPEGNIHVLSGTFREVSPPKKLVYTWIWEQGDMAGLETLVTIDFRAKDGGTELALTHEKLPSATSRDRHNAGWSSSFDCLVEILARD
jgi:uncharacterized protein YndB with AHSA1/START domain